MDRAMFQGIAAFTCCQRSCGNGTKSKGTRVVKGLPPRAASIKSAGPPNAEAPKDCAYPSWSEFSERPLSLPRWGSVSDIDSQSDIREVTNVNGDYKLMLDRCALSLKASVVKARHEEEREAHGRIDDSLLPSLRAVERNCALFADHDSKGDEPDLASSNQRKTLVADASSLEHGVPHLSQLRHQLPLNAVQCFSEPAGVHIHTTHQEDSGEEASEGDASDDGGIDERYSHQNIPQVIQGLREQMRTHGIQPLEAQVSSHRGAMSHGRSRRQGQNRVDVQSKAEVEKYQALMRAKFEAMGMPGVQSDVFVDTARPSLAVRDAVSKYHTHCRDMNRYYMMPGEKVDEDECLSQEQHMKLEHYVRGLQDEIHAHVPQK